MVRNNIDYFEYINNFIKIEHVESILIKGKNILPNPKVSILIPTYKREILLKEAIDSALNQFSFDDYQVIIIDNNPERNCLTEKLINEINNEKILYYKNSVNIGMFGNWNRGFELSKSEWTVLLHDDDIISPYFLNTCSRYFQDNSIAIIKPEIVNFSNKLELDFKNPIHFKKYRYYLFDFIYGCTIGAPTNVLYNTSKLISSGGFNQDYFPCSDYVSSANIARRFKAYKLKCVLGGYRVSDNESLNTNTLNLYYEHKFYISSFIMKFYKIPSFFIYIIQSAWIEHVMRGINSFYKIKYKYDYENKLQLAKLGFFTKNLVYIICRLQMIFIDIFRVWLK
jgi:glycosyltransferase involved in cell wall biosynthesis